MGAADAGAASAGPCSSSGHAGPSWGPGPWVGIDQTCAWVEPPRRSAWGAREAACTCRQAPGAAWIRSCRRHHG